MLNNITAYVIAATLLVGGAMFNTPALNDPEPDGFFTYHYHAQEPVADPVPTPAPIPSTSPRSSPAPSPIPSPEPSPIPSPEPTPIVEITPAPGVTHAITDPIVEAELSAPAGIPNPLWNFEITGENNPSLYITAEIGAIHTINVDFSREGTIILDNQVEIIGQQDSNVTVIQNVRGAQSLLLTSISVFPTGYGSQFIMGPNQSYIALGHGEASVNGTISRNIIVRDGGVMNFSWPETEFTGPTLSLFGAPNFTITIERGGYGIFPNGISAYGVYRWHMPPSPGRWVRDP